MATRVVCDLCQGPIEDDTLRGCIHLPVPAENPNQHDFMEMFMHSRGNHLKIRGKNYVIKDLDICEVCVRMIKDMYNSHPAGRQS